MKTTFHVYFLLALLSLSLTTSCARKFESNNSTTLPSGSDNTGAGQTPPPGNGNNPNDIADQIKRLDLQSFVSGTDTTKPPVTDLDKTGSGQMIIRIPLPLSSVFSAGAGVHQKYKDITFNLTGDLKTGFSLTVKIPLKYILRLGTFETAAAGRLPNGDALPGPLPEVPVLNITANPNKKEKIYLYLSRRFVGILFESQFDPFVSAHYQLKDKYDLGNLGSFDVIPAKNGALGAFMVSVTFSDELATLLDTYFLN